MEYTVKMLTYVDGRRTFAVYLTDVQTDKVVRELIDKVRYYPFMGWSEESNVGMDSLYRFANVNGTEIVFTRP